MTNRNNSTLQNEKATYNNQDVKQEKQKYDVKTKTTCLQLNPQMPPSPELNHTTWVEGDCYHHCANRNLRFDDGNVNVNDNATNQWFDWLNEEK